MQHEAKCTCPMQFSDMLPPLLRMAIKAGSLETVRSALEQGLDPNVQDATGNALLHHALKASQFEICELLLEHGANPDLKSNEGLSPKALADAYQLSGFLELHRVANLPEDSNQEDDSWIAEEEALLPRSDGDIPALAGDRQSRISSWIAIDLDDDWKDVEIVLPDPVNLGRIENPVVKAIVSLICMSEQCGIIDPLIVSRIMRPLVEDEDVPEELLVKVEYVLSSYGVIVDDCVRDGYSWEERESGAEDVDDEFLEFAASMLSNRYSSMSLFLGLLSKTHPVSKEEEKSMFRQLSVEPNNQAARNCIIMSNLRFAYKSGATFSKDTRGVGAEDRVSEAILGLIKSIDRFDVELDYKFITYAVHWIRQRVQKCVQDNERSIRIPPNKLIALNRFRKSLDKLSGDVNAVLDMDEFKGQSSELAKLLGIAEEDSLESLLDFAYENDADLPFDFAETTIVSHDLELEDKELKEMIVKVLNENLVERESVILKMYYGIGCEKECTFDEIGRQINLTRERVRQIKNKALNKLLKNSYCRELLTPFLSGGVYA